MGITIAQSTNPELDVILDYRSNLAYRRNKIKVYEYVALHINHNILFVTEKDNTLVTNGRVLGQTSENYEKTIFYIFAVDSFAMSDLYYIHKCIRRLNTLNGRMIITGYMNLKKGGRYDCIRSSG